MKEKEKQLVVIFHGNPYLLIGDLDEGGPIVTKDDFEHGRCSYALLCRTGEIKRFHEIIGRKEDLEVIGDCEAEAGIDALIGMLSDPSWPFNR